MSAVEEALERIKNQKGVDGYVISNGYGDLLRSSISNIKSSPETISQSAARLVQTATNVARDLNPSDNLKNIRIKTCKRELVVSHNKDFNVVVIQAWNPANDDSSYLGY